MQVLSAVGTFKTNHPKFASFVEHFMRTGLPEDTVIEVTVTLPGQEPVTSNMKVLQSDLELLHSLKDNG